MTNKIKRLFASVVAVMTIVVLAFLEPFFDLSFSLHMLFHVILIYVLAPALLTGRLFFWLLPKRDKTNLIFYLGKIRSVLSFLTNSATGILLSSAVLWLGHVPEIYDSSMQNDVLHAALHVVFLVTFLFYWSPLVSSPLHLPHLVTNESSTLYILISATQGMILGAIIAFSNEIIYAYYSGLPHLGKIPALTDQQIGGVIMLLTGSLAYATAEILILKK